MLPVHPEMSWLPQGLRSVSVSSPPPFASPAATAVYEAASLVPPSAAFADARRFLGLETVALPEPLAALASYANERDASVTQAGLTAALQEIYAAGHRRLEARADTSAAAAQRLSASTGHLIELVDHVYALFEDPKEATGSGGGAVDFVRVSACFFCVSV